MSDLAVITPSFAPDAELFAELHQSVLDHTSAATTHHVIVPPAHTGVFARFAGPRCRIWTESDLLPRHYIRLPRAGQWINVRRPWPPVRGWVIQQALKIAAAGQVDADVVLIADSDVVLVRQADMPRFQQNGRLSLYRRDRGVHAGMPQHIRWHAVARRLLGLPAQPPPPLDDYISSLNVWDPAMVRSMQRRISETTGRHWLDAFTAEWQISEFILYGVFVDEVASALTPRLPADTTFCLDYWDRSPLDRDGAYAFVNRMGPDVIGMMISAKSRTPLDVRRAAAAQAQAKGEGQRAEH